MILPLHNPFHLAKQAATLQELSGGRAIIGVGMGWYEREFEFMGVEFAGRGRRGDEAIRLMRALWNGERRVRRPLLVVQRRDRRAAAVAAAGDLGRRQLGSRDSAGA